MATDQDARRSGIARAVVRLVDRDGVRAATVRAVAGEAGIATGSVRHFFATQEELRRFALHETITAITDRLATGASERVSRARTDAVAASFEVLEQLLPLDEGRQRESRVYAAFAAEAAHDAEIAAVRDEMSRELTAAIRHVVGSLATLDSLGAGRDVELETDRLRALLDGLTALLLADGITADRACAVLRAHLEELTAPVPPTGATP